MMRSAVTNVAIQAAMAGMRYLLQIHAFKNVSLEIVGQISLVLTFVTSITFIAGLELHQHVNRPILLGKNREVRGIQFRVFFGTISLILLSVAFPFVVGLKFDARLVFLIFFASSLEYLNLELGRLLIINKRYLVVATFSALRGLAPFIPSIWQPITLEASLAGWAVVSLISAMALFHTLRTNQLVERSAEPLVRSDVPPAFRFFLVGGISALLPFLERLCIARILGLDTLGAFALLIIFVGMGDLLLQSMLWQPFLRPVTQRLAAADKWRTTIVALFGATCAIYGGIFAGLALFATQIFTFLEKSVPAGGMIAAVFLYGSARGSFTIWFQLYYANHAERVLPYLQASIAGGILLSYYTAATLGLEFTSVLLMVASSWVVFPALALSFHLPDSLRRQVS